MSTLLDPNFHIIFACKEKPFAEKLGERFRRRKAYLSVTCVDNLEDAQAEATPESTLFVMDDKGTGAKHLNDFKQFCDEDKKWAVMLLTETLTLEYVQEINRKEFIAGCLLRKNAGKELPSGVTIVAEGEKFYSAQLLTPHIGKAFVYPQYLDSFDNRDSETFYHMCKRLRCKEMAVKMELEECTVRKYRSIVIHKVAEADYKDVLDCGRFFGIVED